MIYLDTSVIAPLYWPEALSDAVEQLLLNETTSLHLPHLPKVRRNNSTDLRGNCSFANNLAIHQQNILRSI